jgi:ArsR family transcriptional regulator
MEAVLGVRQAAISQQLMMLRDAGLVVTVREGRNIFYQLAHPEMYDAVCQIAVSSGIAEDAIKPYAARPVVNCPCPKCNPDMDPELACKKLPVSMQEKNL